METNKLITVDELLQDPATPYWAKDTIRVALTKDALDAAVVLQVIAIAFQLRLDEILKAQKQAAKLLVLVLLPLLAACGKGVMPHPYSTELRTKVQAELAARFATAPDEIELGDFQPIVLDQGRVQKDVIPECTPNEPLVLGSDAPETVEELEPIVLHMYGHCMFGLKHVKDEPSVMNPAPLPFAYWIENRDALYDQFVEEIKK